MAKSPTKPGGHSVTDDPDLDTGKQRAMSLARSAIARTEQIVQRLDEHVQEDGDRFDGLSRDVDEVRTETRAISRHVGDLRVDMAKTLVVLRGIDEALAKSDQIKHMTLVAELETGKAAKIATIEDTKDSNKARRTVLLKVALGVVTAIGTLLGMLIERYR